MDLNNTEITSENIDKISDNVYQMNVIVQDSEIHNQEEEETIVNNISTNEDGHNSEDEENQDLGLSENNGIPINEGQINFHKPYIQQFYSESVPVPEDNFSISNYENHDYDTYRDPFRERSVSFNDIKQINYFFKDEIEMDPKSSSNLENSNGIEEEEEDDEYYNDYYGRNEYDEDGDEEEYEEEDDEDYSDDFEEEDEEEEDDEEVEDDDDDEDNYANKRIPYQKQRISNKFDVSSDEVDEDEEKKVEDDEDEDDESFNSVEEHSDVENILDESILKRYKFSSDSSEIEKNHLMNIRDSIDKTKFEKLKREQDELDEINNSSISSLNISSNSESNSSSTSSTPNSGLRSWAQRGIKPIKFSLSPSSSPNTSTIKLPIVSPVKKDQVVKDEDEEEDEYQDDLDDMIIHDDIENEKLTDIISIVNGNTNHHELLNMDEDDEDEDNEKIMEVIKSRSLLEGNLIEIRNKVEMERQKLKEYFTKAKEDLKLSISNVTKYYNGDSNSNGVTSNGLDHRNELEEVSKSLIELEVKIVEIEESLGRTKLKPNSKTNKTQTKINSLLDEIVSLKEQIEKEKVEKLNQDIELKDITNHLLEMASQLSDAIINNSPLNIGSNSSSLSSSGNNSSNNLMFYSSSPNNSSFSTSTTNNNNNNIIINNNNGSMEKEIEFYRVSIEQLEKRLIVWKHHNEMLHLELLNGKQINSQELSDLSFKITKIEEERDKLSLKIDELVQSKGELEGREQVLSTLIDNLKSDNIVLSETIQEMQRDSEIIQVRFNQLVAELHEMGENAVEKLQGIINELVYERSELQSSIKNAEVERLNLVKELNGITDKLILSENSNQQLLNSTSSTMKSLENSEFKCQDLQNQLSTVTKRLNWAESEVDRLTKEMDRLIKINVSEREHIEQESQKIRLTFSFIREQALGIKLLLSQEKNEIIQLGSDISFILEKGKLNTSKTIKSLRDFVLKEVETTKLDINNKLEEIESNLNQNQNQDLSQVETNQILLNEMTQQKFKLNEMQNKIVKMESQINQISEFNITNTNSSNNNNNNNNLSNSSNNINNSNDNPNNWERDQVVQLMKLENKIRKIEAGISEIIEYKTPQTNTTPISTTTITTTTTTHHTYTNENIEQPEFTSSPLFINNPNVNDEPVENNNTTNQFANDQNTTINTNGEDNPENTLENPIDDTTTDNTTTTTTSTTTTNNQIKSLILDSLLLGGGSILSNVFYQLMYNKSSTTELPISTLMKSSLKFGLILTSLGGIIKFTTLFNSKQHQQQQYKIAPVDQQPKLSSARDVLVSGIINASIFGGILYLKNRKPIDLLFGGLIGFANGLIIKYK